MAALASRASYAARQTISYSTLQSRTLFGLPSFPFPSGLSLDSSSSSTPPKGTLRKEGSISIYAESKRLPYTPQEIYMVIADVDSYHEFLPFATESRVTAAEHIGHATDSLKAEHREKKGWVASTEPSNQEGDRWSLKALLKIGAMGYEESYVSTIQTQKWNSVSASAEDSSIFKHLFTKWSFDPAPGKYDQSSAKTASETDVDLRLEYQFTSPLHAAAVSAVWKKVSGMMIHGFEKRLLHVYGR